MSITLNNGNYAFGIFDFDGNILNTTTPVILKNKTTGEIERITGSEIDQNPEKYFGPGLNYEYVSNSFSESRDYFSLKISEHRGFNGMFQDVIEAVENNNFAPSFDSFKDVYLLKARVFGISTARGNSADNFQKAFTYINEKTLTKEEKENQYKSILKNYNLPETTTREEAVYHYFGNIINYIPCSNPQIEKIMNFKGLSSAERKAKTIYFFFEYFVGLLEDLNGKKIEDLLGDKASISMGFSDDSEKNIVSIGKKFIKLINSKKFYPGLPKKFSVYFTGNPQKYENILEEISSGDKDKITSKKTPLGLKIKIK